MSVAFFVAILARPRFAFENHEEGAFEYSDFHTYVFRYS